MTETEERDYIIACAKKERAFYACLLNDWKRDGVDFEGAIRYFKHRGLEDTNNEKWVESTGVEHKQIDFLGSFVGFTMQDYGNGVEIGYIWAFDGCSTELAIDKQGRAKVL